MIAIHVSDLIKRFDTVTALQGISFSVSVGETFGFLGPNGAGKTTTIRILTRISPPTSGRASILGKDVVTETIAARKEIGIVHETSNVYDDLSARILHPPWECGVLSLHHPPEIIKRIRYMYFIMKRSLQWFRYSWRIDVP